VKQYSDHSIFDWSTPYWSTPTWYTTREHGERLQLFASSPREFATCTNRRSSNGTAEAKATHYLLTNQGLLIDLAIIHVDSGDYFAKLDINGETEETCLAMPLRQLPGRDNVFYRSTWLPLLQLPRLLFAEAKPISIYLATGIRCPMENRDCGLSLNFNLPSQADSTGASFDYVSKTFPHTWNLQACLAYIPKAQNSVSKCVLYEDIRLRDTRSHTILDRFILRIEYEYIEIAQEHGWCGFIHPRALRCFCQRVPDRLLTESLPNLLLADTDAPWHTMSGTDIDCFPRIDVNTTDEWRFYIDLDFTTYIRDQSKVPSVPSNHTGISFKQRSLGHALNSVDSNPPNILEGAATATTHITSTSPDLINQGPISTEHFLAPPLDSSLANLQPNEQVAAALASVDRALANPVAMNQGLLHSTLTKNVTDLVRKVEFENYVTDRDNICCVNEDYFSGERNDADEAERKKDEVTQVALKRSG